MVIFCCSKCRKVAKKADSCQLSSQLLVLPQLGIVVIADTTKSDACLEDASITSIILQLQTHDVGLGNCWLQLYNRENDDNFSSEVFLLSLLGFPFYNAVLFIISIGYPD